MIINFLIIIQHKKMEINTKKVNQIISKSKLPDADYVCNPYVGCPHKCIYCYAEFMKRFVQNSNEWGNFIYIKEFDKVNKNQIKKGQTVLFSSVTDPYNPFEHKYQATRKALSQLIGTDSHVEILTKSSLVIRDIDILKKFSDISVGISMNTLDDSFRKKTEPGASSISQRLEALKELKNNDISTYLFISPIFPEITNCKEIIDSVYNTVDYICFENLNLRGNYKNRVMELIKDSYLDLTDLYNDIFIKKDNSYWEKLKEKIELYCNSVNVKYKTYFYHDKIKKR